MRIAILRSARLDAEWFREYYGTVFPSGGSGAATHFREAKRLLKSYPQIGHPSDTADLRELQIFKTPFVIVYRIRADEIQIIRIWDQRAERPKSWT